MKLYSLPIILASTLLAQLASAQATSSTPIIGYYKMDVPNGQSAWVCGFVGKKDFQSAATSITGGASSIINVSGTPFATLTFPSHYVEILSGPSAGLILDITAKTDSSVTVDGDLGPSGANLSGTETFCIRKHATLSTVFQDIGALAPFADSVTLYNSDNTLSSYYPSTPGNWLADDFATPANDTIIYPGQGFIIDSTGNNLVTIGGGAVSYVKTGPTKVPVYMGQTNFVGPINPLVATNPTDPLYSTTSTTTTGGGNMTLISIGFVGSGLEPFTDSITLFTQGGNLDPAGGYYVSATNVFADDFTTNADNVLLRNGYAVVVTAENADRVVSFKQVYPAN